MVVSIPGDSALLDLPVFDYCGHVAVYLAGWVGTRYNPGSDQQPTMASDWPLVGEE
jgi:hypothetical protein